MVTACSLEEKLWQTYYIKKQRCYFAHKGLSSQSYGFSSSHVWMWELDYKESWVPKDWCFWTVVLEKTLESPLDCKEIQPAHPEGNQSWISIGGIDAAVEALILWPPDTKNWLIGILNIHWRDWCWSGSFSTLATWCEELTRWKPSWCWEGLKAGGQGDNRGWDGCITSPTQWTWVWAHSLSWWWTEKPDVLQTMGLQRVRYDWVTELSYAF